MPRSTPHRTHFRRLLLVLAVGGLLSAVVTGSAGSVSSAEDPEPWWEHLETVDFPPAELPPLPGTPDTVYPELPQLWEIIPGYFMPWVGGTHSVGRTESVQSMQRLRLPDTQFAFGVVLRQKAGLDPCTSKPFPGLDQINTFAGAVVAMPAPRFDPDRPHRFGEFPPVTVRTVAFGAVPVEATLSLRHVKDDHGRFLPLISSAVEYKPVFATERCRSLPFSVMTAQTLKGLLELRVTRLVVDGQEVPVGPSCRTRDPLVLDLSGKPYVTDEDDNPPLPPSRATLSYLPTLGGYLKGTVDIAPFSGCGAGGEDLDPLITMAVSGDDTPLEIFQSTIGTGCFPSNEDGCESGPTPFPLDSDRTY